MSTQVRMEALRLALAIKPMEYTEAADHRYQQLGGYPPTVRKGGWTTEQFIEAAGKIETWINGAAPKAKASVAADKSKPRKR